MTIAWFRAASACALLFAALPAFALDVGDKAPEIDVSEWLQGGAARLGDEPGKKIWLIVLWGTFESDCIEAMPELNKVYGKHKNEGFDIAAVSTEPADQVRRYLANHKLDYRVAVDQFHKTSETYGKDERKFPIGFLVDRSGAVVWKGNPRWGLERILTDVLSGTFDAERAKVLAKRQDELSTALWEAFSGKWEELIVKCQEVLDADPSDGTAFSYITMALQQKDDHERYKSFMKQHVERCKDDADALQRAAEELSTGSGYEWRDVELALSAIKRAVELRKSGDADVLATHGRILFMIGLIEPAIAEMKKALALEPTDDGKKELVAYYEACAAARKKAAQPVKPKR
jgi:peroxiredoxin